MFSENDGGLLFQKLDDLDEKYLISYLNEGVGNDVDEENKYSIKDWYECKYKDKKLFTDCSELMKIIHLLTHYYLEKNYGAIEYIEEMEMKLLSDYMYYYISSKKDIKLIIRSLVYRLIIRSFIKRSFLDLSLISLFYTISYLI
jgi:hypothetical protein